MSEGLTVSPGWLPPRQLAVRLVDRARAEGSARPDFSPAVVALERLYLDLARWVGLDGCHALFTRALAQAQAEHPLLVSIQLHARSVPYLEGIAETIEQHGAAKTNEALAAMLVIVIQVLGRLIGDEMATILIERGLPGSVGGNATSETRRAEAWVAKRET